MNTPQRFVAVRREQSRRNFLSWLGVGAAAALATACASATRDDAEAAEMTDEELASAAASCRPTSKDATGPYWEAGAPYREVALAEDGEPGVKLAVEGRLVGPDCRTPLANYTLDIWQADAQGSYHSQGRLRGKIRTDSEGKYAFSTVLPGRYGDSAGIRPAHIHVSFLSPGQNKLLTTQMYFAGDPYLGQEDYCTRQGTCNSSDGARILTLSSARNGVGKTTKFDAILPRT